MKRSAAETSALGPRKRQAISLYSEEDSTPDNDVNAASSNLAALPMASHSIEDSEDDIESLLTETNLSSGPHHPQPQTAATSVAASTTSRAGRKFPSDLKTIQCPEPGCGKTFNRPARLAAHMRSHSNDRPFKCTVPSCGKSYMEEKHLRQHVKGSHSPERKYICEEPDCGKAFLTGTRLRRHAAVHEGANRFRCSGYEDCSQSFRKHQTLQRHIRTVHLGQKPYVCGTDGCKEDFDSPNAMKRHVERCHGEPPEPKFWCDQCEEDGGEGNGKAGFTTMHLLQVHIREMHIVCPFCDAKCSGQWMLEKHIDDFHSGKTLEDRKTIVCTWPGCPRKFVKIANLNTHIKTAHQGHRLVCGQVDTFQWSEDIADWNWMEEGCGDTFISKMKLEEHIRFVHLGKKRPPQLYPDPTAYANVIDDLSGKDDASKRDLLCSVDGCGASFIRYHDLGLHMQREHNNGYGEQDIGGLAAAAHPGRHLETVATNHTLMPVDPLLQKGVDMKYDATDGDEVFWLRSDFPAEQRDDSFERDLLDMRKLIDVDALVD